MNSKALVPSQETSTEIAAAEHGTAVALQRTDSEVKSALVMARHFPRNESDARQRLMTALQRHGLAEDATYSYDRGGAKITGPSVDLAREAAKLWGNISYGQRIVEKTEDWIHVMGFAMDLETNTRVEKEDRFRRMIQRKRNGATVYVEPDEREERELTSKRGAICERNAILNILPKDLIEDAVEAARKTVVAAANKQLAEHPEDVAKKLATAFAALGVTVEMLEKKLGHPLKLLTPDEVVTLKALGKALKDGSTTRDNEFEMPKPTSVKEQRTLETLIGEKMS